MKKCISLLAAIFFLASIASADAQILKKIKDKVNQRTEEKVDKTIDKGIDGNGDAAKENSSNKKDDVNQKENQGTNSETRPQDPGSIKIYQNYDFVPGDKILFEDNFRDDQDGEFATHWELKSGQAVLNKVRGELALNLTEGNYVRVAPRMKTETYLSDPFTIEFDYYFVPGAYGILTMLKYYSKEEGYEKEAYVQVSSSEVSFSGKVSFSKTLPDEISGENFNNKWHHIAIAFKNHQIKVYVDQYRILVVPDTKENYEKIEFAGIGSEVNPIIFRNVRVASGGNMNMIGKKFTDAKIVTHGINFDYNKATLRPESMGTLNMILQVMKDNPDIKFEVGGHTDSDGDNVYNVKLSQQRADAVRDQLIKMGIDASRLTAKGYGENKPIGDNSSLEGKANNRRVEFVKI